jgi:LacI family transcriptional regulator
LLSSTDWTLQQIAERLNFSHSEYLGVAFKAHRPVTGPVPPDSERPGSRQAFWQEKIDETDFAELPDVREAAIHC